MKIIEKDYLENVYNFKSTIDLPTLNQNLSKKNYNSNSNLKVKVKNDHGSFFIHKRPKVNQQSQLDLVSSSMIKVNNSVLSTYTTQREHNSQSVINNINNTDLNQIIIMP